MAQEFKDFDKVISKDEIAECRKFWLYDVVKDISEVERITSWDYFRYHEVFSNSEIREVVYFAEDHYQWQVFRVSLKGLTTKEKIFMLDRRLKAFGLNEGFVNSDRSDKSRREHVRIHNYIGALRRGGQLDSNHHIVK